MVEINYFIIMLSALVAIASPGPSTLAIASASMNYGRPYGLSLATGVLTGSFFWSISAAFGLAAVMHTNVWLFEALRYFGALYLLYLAYRLFRSALKPTEFVLSKNQRVSLSGHYSKGLLIHLTNPKAVLFFGSLYSIGIPASASMMDIMSVVLAMATLSTTVFLGYAVLFSFSRFRKAYFQLKVYFETVFSLLFSYAGFKLLVSKIEG